MNILHYKKYKSSTLLYTIVIAFIIFLVLLSFIQLSSLKGRLINREIIKDKINSNINSALTIFLQKNKLENQEIAINNEKPVSLEIEEFGAFIIIKLRCQISDIVAERRFLSGTINEPEKYAIVLPERNNELILSGNTIIKGDVLLPKLGVKQSIVNGISFSGNRLIDGKISKGPNDIPKPNQKLGYIKLVPFSGDSVVLYSDILNEKEIKQKFKDKRVTIYSKEKILIGNKSFSGNIMIISEKAIQVDNNSILKDIILNAPYIEIKKNFVGNIQTFATDSIVIEENVKLNYPSFIGLYPSEYKDDAVIKLGSKSVFAGSILGLNKTKISIRENASIYGTIYNQYSTELKGRVYGTVITENFILNPGLNEYIDVIQNGEINTQKRPTKLASAFLFDEFKTLKIIKELE